MKRLLPRITLHLGYASFLMILVLTTLSSCSPFKKLELGDISMSEFRMESSTKASIVFKLEVDNKASYPITCTTLEATMKKDMDLFANAFLKQDVEIPPMTKGSVYLPIEISLCDPMSLLSMGLNVKKWDMEEFLVNGKMVLLKNHKAKKTYKIKNKTLKSIVDNL